VSVPCVDRVRSSARRRLLRTASSSSGDLDTGVMQGAMADSVASAGAGEASALLVAGNVACCRGPFSFSDPERSACTVSFLTVDSL